MRGFGNPRNPKEKENYTSKTEATTKAPLSMENPLELMDCSFILMDPLNEVK